MSEFRTDAGAAGRRHSDITPELRQLAQTLLERLDPAVRLAAARVTGGGAGKCEQVWCPVCALAALVTGEQHPLLTVVAEHSVALLAVIRAMAENLDDKGDGKGPDGAGHPDPPESPSGPPEPPTPPEDEPPPSGPGRYEQIPVTIDE